METKRSPPAVEQNMHDSDNSNKLFSYPGKGRNKLKNTLNHLNDATILALYGDNFESEPILQIRVRFLSLSFIPFNASFKLFNNQLFQEIKWPISPTPCKV